MNDRLDVPSLVHHAIVRGFIDSGACPSSRDIQRSAGVDESALEGALRRLEDVHGVVLGPSDGMPWVIHPFSSTPTGTYVENGTRGWWAPCLWCGLGVATLVGGDVRIHTRLGGEREAIVVQARDGHPIGAAECCVHFAIPPRDAWKNVHAHCAMLLPFRTEDDARDWSTRHGLPFGEVISLDATAALARSWYGRHADRDWRKWTVAEAQSIFSSVGLRSSFWDIGDQHGRF